jgi:molybdate transport system substrate-binding protein
MANVLRLCLLACFFVASAAGAQEIRVAAAADLTAALPPLVQQFESDCHCKVVVTFGSSGNFYQQLQNGAPFDIFLSADLQYPQKLQEAGLTVPGSLTGYASGKIVLWTRNESKLDLSKGLKVLTGTTVKRIAIANPQHAPYGRAAESALKAEGVYDEITPKLVFGENISQTALFAQSGNADAGIIALSLALNPTMKSAGRFVEIPASEYPAIRQAAIILKSSKNIETARRFVQFLSSARGAQVLQQFGFSTK